MNIESLNKNRKKCIAEIQKLFLSLPLKQDTSDIKRIQWLLKRYNLTLLNINNKINSAN